MPISTISQAGLDAPLSLTSPTLTTPTISSPIMSGTLTGTYTLGGTPKFPAGIVLQVVSTTKTSTASTTSSTFSDITGLSVSITPTSTTSKILVLISANASSSNHCFIRLLRGATPIGVGDAGGTRIQSTLGNFYYGNNFNNIRGYSANYLDSPATTSATTYKLQWATYDNATAMWLNTAAGDTDAATVTRTISSITVMEISA